MQAVTDSASHLWEVVELCLRVYVFTSRWGVGDKTCGASRSFLSLALRISCDAGFSSSPPGHPGAAPCPCPAGPLRCLLGPLKPGPPPLLFQFTCPPLAPLWLRSMRGHTKAGQYPSQAPLQCLSVPGHEHYRSRRCLYK